MAPRSFPYLTVVLSISLALNLSLIIGNFAAKSLPAHGQAVSQGVDILMATEQSNDQTPVCFVLDTKKPHLLLYKTDSAGQLQLTSARDIQCDLKLRDNYLPRGKIVGGLRTQPPVSQVSKAVHEKKDDEKEEKQESQEKEKEKEKEKEEN